MSVSRERRASTAARIGREFAANAEESHGRSMIVMGAGTNHWFHSDTIYRALTMSSEERRLRAGRLREIVRDRDPEKWIAEQLADIESRRDSDV